MRIEIDQSIKIEQTEKDTILGLCNNKVCTALLPRKIKRQLQEEFRQHGKPRLFVYRTFIAAVVLLIKYANLKDLTDVVIDIEYHGQERLLRSIFFEMWSRCFDRLVHLDFIRVGKKSRAHQAGYETMKGRRSPDVILKAYEIRSLVLK